jgi:hypothetical protein
MHLRPLATVWIATLAGCSSLAQAHSAIEVSPHDVAVYSHSGLVGSRYRNATCGYTILANHSSRQFPRPEWAIDVYEVMDDDTPVFRVTASAFRVVSKNRNAAVEARAPITALSFTLQGHGAPLTADIKHSGGPGGGINATLEPVAALELLQALYRGYAIEISAELQDGTTDVLEVHNWSSANVDWKLGYFQDCVYQLSPVQAGVRYYLYEFVFGPGGLQSLHSDVAYCFGADDVAGLCPPEERKHR